MKRAGRRVAFVGGLAAAWAAVLLMGEWAWSGHVLARERERIAGELKRLRSERVERPVLVGPEEDGNACVLIAEAALPAYKDWTYSIWSALSLSIPRRASSRCRTGTATGSSIRSSPNSKC